MLTIDRTAGTSVRDQLVDQLRYQIVSGQYRVGDVLPSTRKLGEQVSVSFHTVRKAYQVLQDEGLVESQVGSGYTITERTPLPKSERMERGAAAVHDTLQHLIGLGLGDAEIEYLFHEQLGLLDQAETAHKVIVAAPFLEMAEWGAAQVGKSLQLNVEAVPLEQLGRHQDADYVLTPYDRLKRVVSALPRADVLGLTMHLPAALLARVARLSERKTIGLVTRETDAIRPLSEMLRAASGFEGQVIAATAGNDAKHLKQFARQADLLLYTPGCRRALRAVLEKAERHAELVLAITADSMDAVRRAVPA